MSEPYAPKRRVYRRNEHRIVLPLLCCGVGAFSLIFAKFVHPAFVLVWIPCLVLAFLIFRIGVFPSSDGVLVRNVVRSRRLAWDEIDRFDWGRRGNYPVGGVYLKDGEFIPATALSPPFELKHGTARAVPRALAGLNHELDRARASGPPTPQARRGAPPPTAQQLRLDG